MSDLLNSLYNNKKTTYYYIHTEKGIYSATIEANPLTNSFCLYLGGTIKGCVIIFLEDYKNIDIAILDSIKYNSSCNITNTLEEGDGTKHMIFTALNILLYYFPKLKYVKLLDTIHKSCSRVDNNGSTISMNIATYFMLFKKETWYESLFGALPINTTNRQEYKLFIDKLDSINISMSFLTFINKYFRGNDINYLLELNKKYNLELDKLYNNSKTYVDFFYSIRDKINNKTELCTLFGLFLFKFMYDISNGATMRFLGDYWIFPTENIVKIDFTEEQVETLSYNCGEHFLDLI